MSLKRALFAICILAVTMAAVSAAPSWPVKPINVIVPWSPGGASDLTARMLAAEMEKVLKQRISITNTPGASGAIGTQAMFDAPHDGYTWSGNADGSIVTYQILGYLKISHKQYLNYLAINTPNVIVVPANSPINDFPALLEAMKGKKMNVASAGVGSGGHQAAEFFKKYAKVDYTHVPYQGGAPAVTGTVKGEVDMVMQLSMEVTEMLRAKQLKAIAVMSPKPLVIEGYGEIPSINKWIPDFPPVGNNFGLFIPRDIPKEAVERIDKAFAAACKSATLKKFAAEKGSTIVGLYGEKADRLVEANASRIDWLLYETGNAKFSPAEFGIAKP